MNPQKYTINILQIKILITNFLKSILAITAAILIINAGVNGSAIIIVNTSILILFIFLTALFKSSLLVLLLK